MAKREKAGNHFRRVAEIEKDHFADVDKMVSDRERENLENGKAQERASRAEPGENTNGSEFPDCSKNKGSNRSGSRQTEETEKKAIRNGRNRTNASMISFSESGRTVRGKEKAPCRGA